MGVYDVGLGDSQGSPTISGKGGKPQPIKQAKKAKAKKPNLTAHANRVAKAMHGKRGSTGKAGSY